MKKSVLFMLMVFVMVLAMAMPVSAAIDFYQLGDITPQEPVGTTLFATTLAADAEFAGGSGTEDDPYLIADKYQLNNVRNYLSAHFKLVADIEFTEADFAVGGAFYNDGAGWEPIGSGPGNTFIGVFDGNGHTIKGLYVNISGTSTVYAGLFAYSDGLIQNLGLVDSVIIASGGSYSMAGGIVALAGGTIRNCYNTGSVSAGSAAGGIAGDSYGEIIDCYNTGKVNVSSNNEPSAGGIVGLGRGTIQNCYNVGAVTATAKNVPYANAGGIAGEGGNIYFCYNSGNILATVVNNTTSIPEECYAGGIAGKNKLECTISDCYNNGDVSGSYAGGISGIDDGSTTQNCYNVGNIHSDSFAGGITGRIKVTHNTIITNCYYLDINSKGVGSGTDTGVKCTFAELQSQETFAGFNFDNVWYFDAESVYKFPVLQGVTHIEKAENTTDFAGGNGTAYNPYQIKTKEHLDNVRHDLGANYKLVADIEFAEADFTEGGAFYNKGAGWQPIGIDEENAFTGVFDGNGHVIKGLQVDISGTSTVYAGLFGCNSGTIRNLGIVDGSVSATVTSASSYAYAGGIAGYNSGTIENCYNTGSVSATSSSSSYDAEAGGIAGYNSGTIENCYNTGSVSATSSSNADAGGIAGYSSGTISNCYNKGSAIANSSSRSSYAGGIAGYSNGTINNTYNTGSVSATGSTNADAGGIAGYSSGTISNCYNKGSAIANSSSRSSYAGGIAGYNNKGTISNCYNTGSVSATSSSSSYDAYAGGITGRLYYGTISNSYNIGSVSAATTSTSSNAYVGGIAGYSSSGTISNCYYWEINSKGVGSGTDTCVKCTIAELQDQDTFAGFNFDNVWHFDAESLYKFPVLQGVTHIEKAENTTDFAGGNGTVYNPYQIKTKDHLNNVRHDLGANYKLVADIEFAEADFTEGGAFYNKGAGWQPIGIDEENAFTGVFDGNGHVIKGLQVNISGTSTVYAGLFGCNRGTIRNLGIVDGSVSATVTSASSYAYVGGIAGYNYKGTISNSYNTGSVSATSTGSSSVAYAGGIVGFNWYGTISNSYNSGSVSAASTNYVAYAGGIVGYNYKGTLSNSYNTGIVSATSTGSSSYAYVGGIAGYNRYIETISNCYYLDINSKGMGSGTDTGVKCTIAELQDQDTFAGFNFDNVWHFDEESSYKFPVLQEVDHIEKAENTTDYAGGNGTAYNPYQIKTKEHLNNVRHDLGANYKLVADIEFTEADFAEDGAFYNKGAGWQPIGIDEENAFTGVFDGNGHFIKGLQLNISGTSTVYAGLFGYNKGAIRNLGIVDSSISATATSSSSYAGGIAGYNDGTISNSYNSGIVSATSSSSYAYAGGIMGYNKGTISNSYNSGSVSATTMSSNSRAYAGGIMGYNKGTISNSYNTGSVSAASTNYVAYAGGITGYNVEGTIENCYNAGSVSANSRYDTCAGGIAGYNSSGTIENCYNTGSVGVKGRIGGIVGYSYSGVISNSYYLDIISKGVASGTDTCVKCTDVEMQMQDTFAGFDFETVWGFDAFSGNPYPQFLRQLKEIDSLLLDESAVTEYETIEGIYPELSGKVYALYKDDSLRSAELTWSMLQDFDVDAIGKHVLDISQGGAVLEDAIIITVKAKSPAALEWVSKPTQTRIIKGYEDLLVDGQIKLTYDNNTTETVEVTDDMVSGYDPETIGTQTITVTYQGKTVTYEVEVVEATAVTVSSVPTKTTYVQGQPLDLTDGKVTITYSNGDTEVVALSNAELDYDKTVLGNIPVTVTIYGVETTFDIAVNEKVVADTFLTVPTKGVYWEGQVLDLTGGSLKVVYESEDNYSEMIPLTMDMISGYDQTKIGIQTILVTYGGQTQTFQVIVKEKVISEIVVGNMPKTEYGEGDALDLTNGTIKVVYTGEDLEPEIIVLTEEMASGFDPAVVGTQTVTVTYNGFITTYNVTVSHKYEKTTEEVAPTCTDFGYTVYSCSVCGDSYNGDEKSALGHDKINHEAQAPTCTAIGWDAYVTCSRCDYTTYVEKEALGHNKVVHEAQAPTCTEIGWTAYETCTRCDYTTYVEKSKLGHNEVAHEAKAPTCDAIGWDAYETCSRCDYTTYAEKAKLGHDKVTHEAQTPTCTEIGWDAYETCSRCDYTTYVEKAKLGHDIVAHEAQASTCTEIGWDAYETCSRCDYTTYVEKAALGHDEVAHEAKAPTCAEIGWDAYETCSRCDYTTYVEKSKLGHDIVAHEAQAPTCTEFGWDAYETCSRCDYTTYVKKSKLGHDEVAHEAKAPTCTEIGWDAYETCTRCDYTTYVEKSKLGHDKVAHEAQAPTCTEIGWDAYDTCTRCDYTTYVEKTKLGHDEIAHEAKTPTCTEIGWDAYNTCTRCDYTSYVEKAALGHDEVAHDAKAPTCDAIGWDAYETCTRCDYTTYVEKSALGHDEVAYDAKAPTCTEVGWDAYETCSRCDYTTYVEKSALGHDKVTREAQAPSCTEIGWAAYETCSRCDYTTYVEKSELGHDIVIDEAKAPTCTETGLTEGQHCSRCDGATIAQEEVPALGHEHGSVVTAPTCTEKGYTTYTCHCGDTYIDDEVAALGHTEVVDKAVSPTCTETGLTEGKHCGVCGETLESQQVIVAKGHSYNSVVTEPTCTKDGYTTHTCTRCNDSYTDSKVSAKGHRWDSGTVVVQPGPVANGEKLFKCLNGCGATYTDSIPATGIDAPSFVDVEPGAYYYDAVAWAVAMGVTSGTSATTFSPDNACTRAQAVTFLWRAAGKPVPQSAKHPFTDIVAGTYYYDAVLWAVENGITSGTSATTFSPDMVCSRSQIVTFLYRAEGQPNVTVRDTFSDVPANAYYAKAVSWAVDNKVTTGTSATTFSPNMDCSRGQIVTFLYRAHQ